MGMLLLLLAAGRYRVGKSGVEMVEDDEVCPPEGGGRKLHAW